MRERVAVILCSVLLAGATVAGVVPAYSVEPWDTTNLDHDERMMVAAFAEIGKMTKEEGLPIGAVVAVGNEIIGRGANHALTGDPRLHAETIALDEAIRTMRRRHPERRRAALLADATVYVTLEPCPMDAGAIVLLRVRRVVLCDLDTRWGAMGTVGNQAGFPHKVDVTRSLLPRCQGQEPGTDNPAARWEAGRRAAQATGQVPSMATVLLHRMVAKFGPG